MAGQSIAQFWADLGIRVQPNEIRKVDKLLAQMEAKFKAFSKSQSALKLDLGDFLKFDHLKLRTSLQRTFDQLSKTTYFELRNFRVDQAHLTSQLRTAMERASATTRFRPRVDERGIRESGRGEGARHARMGLSAGFGAAGGLTLGRVYGTAAGLALGGYGLSALNQRNQQVQSAEMTTQAVVEQAGGTAKEGTQAFNWYRQLANRVGFNYLESADQYNNVLSGITGAGGTVERGQNIFKGFAEYGRVNHIDSERQKRVFRAISQIAGKDQLMSEELTGQLAESLPGAVSLFSAAYQRQTGQSLGVDEKLTGSDAIKALQAAMKKRNVRGDILDVAAQIASERAAPSLAMSARTSQSEQARFENTANDLVRLANQSGVEEGYARLFRTLNDGLQESGPLVKALSEGFNNLTERVRVLMLIPQSFQRLLQGRDSFITDMIGLDKAEEVRKLFGDMETFGKNFSELTGTIAEGWKLIFQQMQQIDGLSITKVMAKQLGIATDVVKGINSAAKGDYGTAGDMASKAGKGYIQTLTTIPRGILDFGADKLGFGDNAVSKLLGLNPDPKAPGGSALNSAELPGITPISGYAVGVPNYQNPFQNIPSIPYDQVDAQGRVNGAIQRYTDPTLMQNQMQKDVAANTTNNNDNRVNVTVGDITVQSQATDAAGIGSDIGQQLRDVLNNTFSDTRINYPSIGR